MINIIEEDLVGRRSELQKTIEKKNAILEVEKAKDAKKSWRLKVKDCNRWSALKSSKLR